MNSQFILEFDYGHGTEAHAITKEKSKAYADIDRPIHYLGSKLRLMNQIREVVNQVDASQGPICDLFAGSGTVSKALSSHRDVVAVDIQEYSRVVCSALLKPAEVNSRAVEKLLQGLNNSQQAQLLTWAVDPLITYEAHCQGAAASGNAEPLCDLIEHGSLINKENNICNAAQPALCSALAEVHSRLGAAGFHSTPDALVTRYFGGSYFSFLQASQLDIILRETANLPCEQRDTFLAAILSTASEIVNTVGKQFAQPLRPRSSNGTPKPSLAQLTARDRSLIVFDVYQTWLMRYLSNPKSHRQHTIIREDYQKALKDFQGNISVVYADPPYTRDHYSRFYHVLETLCLRDNPEVSAVKIKGKEYASRGIYRKDRYQSPFCIKSQAPAAFTRLFSEVRRREVPLILSYSPYKKDTTGRPRMMTIQEIETLARKHYKRVETLSAGKIAHNKLNNAEKNSIVLYDAEVLIVCEP